MVFSGAVLTGATLFLSALFLSALVLCAFILPTLAFTRVVRLYQSRFPWVPFILGELLAAIMKGLAFVRTLFLRLFTTPFMGCPFFLGSSSPFDATRPVEANPVMLVNERPVNIGVVDVHTGVPTRAVIEKMTAFPTAAPKTGSEITKAVIDSPVEPDVWSPEARVPSVESSGKAPPSGSPKISGFRGFYPNARDPIVVVVVPPGPITRDPKVSVVRARRLVVNGNRGRSDGNRDIC
jgi:hypothetical protein